MTQERLFSKRSIQWWFILATESEENRAKASKFFQSSLISKILHFAAIDFSSIHCTQIPLVAICTTLYIEFQKGNYFHNLNCLFYYTKMTNFKLQSIQLFIQKFLLSIYLYGTCNTSYWGYDDEQKMAQTLHHVTSNLILIISINQIMIIQINVKLLCKFYF